MGAALKVAVTELLLLRVRAQVAVPLQAPLQPVKAEFAAGVAVSVNCVPLLKLALQVVPQLIPAGLLTMVPEPLPAAWTLN
jgi:hypothetical protein